MPELAYPRHVHRRGGVYLEITSDEAYQQALAAGWHDQPLQAWPVPAVYRAYVLGEPLDPEPEPDAVQPEPDALVSAPAIVPVQPQRGRPRKTPTASKDAT